MKLKNIISILLLSLLLIIPFNVEAKDYKLMISYFSNGGKITNGNAEVISGVIFLKNNTVSDITYTSNQTINHINSLDGTNTFTLKKGNNNQTVNREWYVENYMSGKKVYLSNSKAYSVKEIIKKLNVSTTYYEQTGLPLEIYVYANFDKYYPVKSIEMNTSILKIKKERSATLKTIFYPSNATDKSVTWSSEDPTIATVDQKGNVKGIKAGTTKIVAQSNDGNKIAKCLVTVDGSAVSPIKVEITSYPSKLIEGDSKVLTAKVYPTNATNKKVTWTSNNPKIATIDNNGKIKALKAGTVKITAKVNSDIKKTVSIKIEKKNNNYVIIKYNSNSGKLINPHSIRISEKNGKLLLDKVDVFHKYSFSNKASKNDLANYNNIHWLNIEREGYRAKPGKEWNTKKDGTGKSYSQTKQYGANDFCKNNNKDCTVTLYVNWEKSPVTKISVSKEVVNVEVGKTVKVTATADSKTGFIWTVANPDIAKVDKGVITGLNKGSTTIKVRAKSNRSVYKTIRVNVLKKSTDTIDNNRNGYVYFLDIRPSSDSILIKSNGHYGLIDTGVKSDGKNIVNKIHELGVKKLDFLMITHAHGDHMGGYEYVLNNVPIEKIYLHYDGLTKKAQDKRYKKMINQANSKKISICDVKLTSCQSFHLGYISFKLYNTKYHDARILKGIDYVVHKGRFENVNSIGAVANINGKRVYFSGDIGNYFGQNAESKTAKEIGDVDIYKVAHHGYVTFNNNQDALNKIKAEYAVFTNSSSIKNSATTTRLKKANKNLKKMYYTSKGLVKLKIDSNGKINFSQD